MTYEQAFAAFRRLAVQYRGPVLPIEFQEVLRVGERRTRQRVSEFVRDGLIHRHYSSSGRLLLSLGPDPEEQQSTTRTDMVLCLDRRAV